MLGRVERVGIRFVDRGTEKWIQGNGAVSRSERLQAKPESMDDLDRVFHRLVSNIRHRHSEYLTLPFTVQELFGSLGEAQKAASNVIGLTQSCWVVRRIGIGFAVSSPLLPRLVLTNHQPFR